MKNSKILTHGKNGKIKLKDMITTILIIVALFLVWLAFMSKRTFDKADDLDHREIKTSRTVFPPSGRKDWYGH